jgi:hypothetical protein
MTRQMQLLGLKHRRRQPFLSQVSGWDITTPMHFLRLIRQPEKPLMSDRDIRTGASLRLFSHLNKNCLM